MYDLIIVGGGPAGYVAAERAGALGAKCLLIERDRLGGVCLNAGCIPTKAFLHAAKLYAHAREASAFGVCIAPETVSFDYAAMKARTEKVQESLRRGIAGLMRRAKAEVVTGSARLAGRGDGGFVVEAGDERHVGAKLLLCTGSRVATPPIPGLTGNPSVITSDGMLARETLAESLVVIGGGVIGLEFACFHALLGRSVTVIEMLPAVGGAAIDAEASKTVQRALEGMGVAFRLGAKVERVEGHVVHYRNREGAMQTVEAECVLSAVGRIPSTEGLGLETLGVEAGRGAIRVDEYARTNVADVYAAGDCTGRIQLAHYASRQATVAVRTMFGQADRMRESAIPSVIYTDPEVAQVGLTEAEAKARGIAAKVKKMPMGASGRYLAESEGGRAFVKALIGEDDGAVLGMTIVGPYASEMIGAACIMKEMEMRATDVSEIVFPHPTVAELMHDVML